MNFASTPDVTYIDRPVPPRKLAIYLSARIVFIAAAAIVCLLVMILFPPVLVIGVAAGFVATTIILITAAVCSKGWFKAFSIGAMVPHAMVYLIAINGLNRPEEVIVVVAISLLSSFCFGLLAAATQGYLKRRGGVVPIPNIPGLGRWFTNQ